MQMETYLYLLHCADGSFYTGITEDLVETVSEHIEGSNPDLFTYSRRPVKLVMYEKFSTPDQALQQKITINSWHRKKKLELLSRSQNKATL